MVDKIFRAMRFGLRRSREVQHSLNRIPQDIRYPLLESGQESFVSDLERVRLINASVFGNRPLCTVLRPRFMTPEQYRFLQSRMHMLLRAFDKAYHAAMEDAGIRKQFGLLDWEEELIHHDPGFRDASPTSRVRWNLRASSASTNEV